MDIDTLQKKIGIEFQDRELLEQALVHSSFTNERPDIAPESNERLEFLGDAILGMVVAEQLYESFPHYSEGDMTRIRAALVCGGCLAVKAQALDLGCYLFMGKGEAGSGGQLKPANLAGAFEALVAVIYLDRGWEVVKEFILRLLKDDIQEIAREGIAVDYKSKLQELIQAREQVTPTYRVIEEYGPDHKKVFVVEVRTTKSVLGTGRGKSKKTAETDAARAALKNLESVTY